MSGSSVRRAPGHGQKCVSLYFHQGCRLAADCGVLLMSAPDCCADFNCIKTWRSSQKKKKKKKKLTDDDTRNRRN